MRVSHPPVSTCPHFFPTYLAFIFGWLLRLLLTFWQARVLLAPPKRGQHGPADFWTECPYPHCGNIVCLTVGDGCGIYRCGLDKPHATRDEVLASRPHGCGQPFRSNADRTYVESCDWELGRSTTPIVPCSAQVVRPPSLLLADSVHLFLVFLTCCCNCVPPVCCGGV